MLKTDDGKLKTQPDLHDRDLDTTQLMTSSEVHKSSQIKMQFDQSRGSMIGRESLDKRVQMFANSSHMSQSAFDRSQIRVHSSLAQREVLFD